MENFDPKSVLDHPLVGYYSLILLIVGIIGHILILYKFQKDYTNDILYRRKTNQTFRDTIFCVLLLISGFIVPGYLLYKTPIVNIRG